MSCCASLTLTLFQCLQRVKRSTFFWDLHALQTLPACLLAWANGCSLDRTSQTIHQEVVSREIELGNNGFTATPEYLTAFGGEGGGVFGICVTAEATEVRSSTGTAHVCPAQRLLWVHLFSQAGVRTPVTCVLLQIAT